MFDLDVPDVPDEPDDPEPLLDEEFSALEYTTAILER
jgi:hypothetical protein